MPEMDYARAIAGSILRKAGIQLRWRTGVPKCDNRTGLKLITAEIVPDAPPDVPSGVRAQSFLSTGGASRIMVYRRRVMNDLCPVTYVESGTMMGHVLAHEITHVLQGFGRHTAAGLMRARWTAEDVFRMQLRTLSLASEDVDLIWEAVGRGSSTTSRMQADDGQR